MRRQSGIEAVAPAAFTITELLVVITIIMILAAVLVPLMQPVLEGRDTREAARQVNALIAAQQGRAVQRGRPAGIWMERGGPVAGEPFTDANANGVYDGAEPYTDASGNGVYDAGEPYTDLNGNGSYDTAELYTDDNSNGMYDGVAEPYTDVNGNGAYDPGVDTYIDFNGNGARDNYISSNGSAVMLFGAEVPPPYAGDTLDARVFIQWPPSAPIGTATFDPPGCCGAAASLVAADDFVKFDYRGPLYRITGTPSATGFSFKLATSGSSPPPETPTDASGAPIPPGVPFQIFRQPRKSAGSPLELPTSTAIDLTLSGVGASGTQFGGGSSPVIILFNPNGRIDRIYSDGFTDRPLGSVHLHIGRVDRINAENLVDQRNIWVSIGNQTGLVTSAQNNGATGVASIGVAREFALRAQNMGGN